MATRDMQPTKEPASRAAHKREMEPAAVRFKDVDDRTWARINQITKAGAPGTDRASIDYTELSPAKREQVEKAIADFKAEKEAAKKG